jgi:hypothetical protein
VEPPSSKSELNKYENDEPILQLLNAILGEIGRTQGGTATTFRAFQSKHLDQSVNKCQPFLADGECWGWREWDLWDTWDLWD